MNEIRDHLDEDELAALAAVDASLRADLGEDADIRLFGSRARRDQHDESDYDLLIILVGAERLDLDAAEDRAEAAMEAAVPGAWPKIQFVHEDNLDDAYFEQPYLPSALRDCISLRDILGAPQADLVP